MEEVVVSKTPILDSFGIPLEYVLIGLGGLTLLLILIAIIQQVKISSLKKKYNKFMDGQDGYSLEHVFMDHLSELDSIKNKINLQAKSLEEVKESLKLSFSKFGIVKYDAFQEMGGKLSFSLALLNENNDGFVINSMHSREGCYTYVKEIVKGESYIVLADEEKEALNNAINIRNYMI